MLSSSHLRPCNHMSCNRVLGVICNVISWYARPFLEHIQRNSELQRLTPISLHIFQNMWIKIKPKIQFLPVINDQISQLLAKKHRRRYMTLDPARSS